MNNVPDWLWQGLTIWATGKGIEWAWHHRKEIARRFSRISEDIVVGLQPAALHAEGRHLGVLVNDQIGITDQVTTRVAKDVGLRWRVEASTPTLARRLEELVSWYLHVS